MFERPRGTNDWGPEEMAKRRFVESRFIQLAESFGFREVSTPTFESLDLFTAKSGPGIVREFYALNAEIIGGAPLPSDAEALALAIGTMRAIGLKQVKARIGNIGVLRSFLPFPPADQGVVLHSLDKRNFPMLDAELARLRRKDLAAPLRKLVELSGDASVLNDAGKVLGDTAKEGLDYLRDLAGLLDDYGISRSDYE